jgi:hypothetical protein
MKVRTTIILFGILILAVVALLLVLYWPKGKGMGAGPLFPGLDTAAVQAIEIKTPEVTTKLKKEGGVWRVGGAGDYPADPEGVDAILKKTASFERSDLASNNPANQSLYRVDTTGVEVKLFTSGEKPAADFFVGKIGPGGATYVRAAGENDVWRIPENVVMVFDRGKRSWRDVQIFALNAEDFTEFSRMSPAGNLTLVKDEKGAWKMTVPQEAPVKPDQTVNMLRVFAALKADGFPEKGDLASFGLTNPQTRLEAVLNNGTKYVLLIGNKNDMNQDYVMKEGGDTVYLVGDYRLQALMRNPETLEETNPPAASAATPAAAPQIP